MFIENTSIELRLRLQIIEEMVLQYRNYQKVLENIKNLETMKVTSEKTIMFTEQLKKLVSIA